MFCLRNIFIILLVLFLGCARSPKNVSSIPSSSQRDLIARALLGSYEVEAGSSLETVASSLTQKNNREAIFRFKSLQLSAKKFQTVQGCLLSERTQGQFRLSWHLLHDGEDCLAAANSDAKASYYPLAGYELSLGSESLDGHDVAYLKLQYRQSHFQKLLEGEEKFYLLNWQALSWKPSLEKGREESRPRRSFEIFRAPFLQGALEGVQFGSVATAEAVKGSVVKNFPSLPFPEMVKCAEWDSDCQLIKADTCHLCQQGYSQIMHGQCPTKGIKFCGVLACGRKGLPPCHLGRTHIENEDFQGCSELSEEWLCAPGLLLDCHARPFPLCH